MEAEHALAAGVRVKKIGEGRLGSRAEVHERQGAKVRREVVGQPAGISVPLDFDAREGCASRLGLDYTGRPAIHVQQVIDEPMPGLELDLPDRNAPTCREINSVLVLYDPTGRRELTVDLAPG
jgi:hypothetical protein